MSAANVADDSVELKKSQDNSQKPPKKDRGVRRNQSEPVELPHVLERKLSLDNRERLIFELKNGVKASEAISEQWESFTSEVKDIYEKTKQINWGKNADYIPQLAKVNPASYGISVCTVNGAKYSVGDTEVDFCVQSVSKPITYCIALDHIGEQDVHKHVGREPSGRGFNAYKLNKTGVPFNPMVNSGAISTCALVFPEMSLSERFEAISNVWKVASGGKIGFDNATYQSEKKTADRNFALGYLLKESGVFPDGANLKETLDLYFQCCSIEINCESLAALAATLANGGVNPFTDKRIFKEDTVRNCLSVMYMCGMYDFSGEWAFSVGLPAKSGVSGALMIVIPGVMGIATWSPPLDNYGNSVRGIAFSKTLIQRYNFHIFSDSRNLRRGPADEGEEAAIITLCYAAGSGKLNKVKQILEQNHSVVNSADYDGRTPLHLASSEGHFEVVKYLISLGANPEAKDRWGNTPLADAERGKFQEILKTLSDAGGRQSVKRGGV